MMQHDLFATAAREPHKLARRAGPATSKLAANSVRSFATAHHAAIFEAMKAHAGTRGLTVHEIAAFCQLDAHRISRRMDELRVAKVLEVKRDAEGNELRRPSPSGRAARVWALTFEISRRAEMAKGSL